MAEEIFKGISIELGDCSELAASLPRGGVKAFICDPPYYTGFKHAKRQAFSSQSEFAGHDKMVGDLLLVKPFYENIMRQMRAAINPRDGVVYWFCDWRSQGFYLSLLDKWFGVTNCLIWDKIAGPGSAYTFSYEMIIFCAMNSHFVPKTEPRRNVITSRAFTSGAKSTNGEQVHPSQKPKEIIGKLIADSTEPGDLVCDLFMGSGTTGVCAYQQGRRFIGFECDEHYFEIAKKRISTATPDLFS